MYENMEMRIYKISTDLTIEREEFLTSNFTKEEENTVFNFFENGNVTYDIIGDDGLISVYYLCSEEALDYIKYLFYKYEVRFKLNDITNDFLIGKVDINDNNFQNYLLENLDVDKVLYKINELGIESLNDIDKKVLSVL